MTDHLATDQISNPQVLFVLFEDQGGDWVVKIPHAYGEDKHFIAPIEEALSLQFHAVKMMNPLTAEKIIGVACIPLKEVDEKDSKESEGKK
jgi:hypothetical protein